MKEIRIITYKPEYRDDFIRLNREWIERFFKIEASDIKAFDNIDSYILDKGGQIFIALTEDGEAAGCCALIPHPERGCHELAKMAVSEKYQGHGAGRKLGEALINYAREHGVKHIFLEGNTRLEASIALYRKLGFVEKPMDNPAYDRCDIMMTLDFRL
ncbi:MAG: GNAT family N-acetyltransferase [Prevotellaceae bacterium]|nr:GNAT family N-acetyltransferase [Prevotellaceae bacterium]